MTSCPDENTFAALLEGRLPPERLAAVNLHLADCPPCRALLAQLGPLGSAATLRAPYTPSFGAGFTGALSQIELLPPGLSVGRYLLREPLGSGGMGVVYAAEDPELHRRVALKVLRGGDQATLLREAQALAQLSHPNVVAVHDIGTFQDRVFVAMELVEGENLAQWLARAPRGWREVLGVFLQAGKGLAAAHARGLVHRDFKPENVLVSREGRVFVTDFGLARSLGEAEGLAAATPPLLVNTTRTL